MPRAAAEDFGFAPGDGLGERGTLEKAVEGFFRFPLAQDHVAANRLHVFVHVALDMAGQGFEQFEHADETALEFLFLAGDDVVMHADGGHWRDARIACCADLTTTTPPRGTPARRCTPGGTPNLCQPAAVGSGRAS